MKKIGGMAVSAIGLAMLTTTNVQALDNSRSSDPLPAVLQESHNHPDAIKTKAGFFVKKKETPDSSFNQDEVVNNPHNTNEKTKMIVANGDIYIKEE